MTSPPDPTGPTPSGEPYLPHRPTSIGPYRIIRVLGEGGMGTVYEAEQENPHRMVALKVIRTDFVIPELLRRFTRESEVLGRLQHPGIAQIYQAGTFEDIHGARPFFAMELVEGLMLTEHAIVNLLDVKQRLALFAKICDAVHYAHQRGVIHRDLKPANILVNATGQPKILDFGVARLTDGDLQATRQTSVGEVIGTIQYMSPEQVNANPSELDTRTDVYSLGVILYELLSGQLPYDLGRKMIHEAARVIYSDDPIPLSSIDRRLRGDVEIIVAKALEKEKSRRYGSAEELASDLRRYLNDEPIVARPATAMYQIRKFARRNRALVGGLTLTALALVAGTTVSVWQAIRATAAERIAESRRVEAVASGALAERRRAQADSALIVADSARAQAVRDQAAATASAARATAEAAKARAINGFLQNMLASSDPGNARGKELSVREVLDKAAAGADTGELRRLPEVRAGIETTIGRTYFGLGLYDQARQHLDAAYDLRRRALGETRGVGEAAYDLGELARASGDYVLAERRVREALAIKAVTLAPGDDEVTQGLATLADIRYDRGDNAEAERLYRRALALTRARHHNAGPAVAMRLRSLGNFLSYNDRADEAGPLLEESLAMVRRAYGDDHPQVVDALIAVSDVEDRKVHYEKAEARLREALPIARRLYGKEHPSVANVISRIGTTVANQHRFDEGETLLREAMAMRIKLLGEQHPDVQLVRVEIGRLLQANERYAAADSILELALAGRRAVLGDSSPAVASTLLDLGRVAASAADWAGAAARYREALPIWRASHNDEEETNTLGELGFVLSRGGKLDEAEPILNDVLTRRKARYGEGHFLVGDSYEKLSAVVFGRGHVAQAESLGAAGLVIRRAVYGPKSPQAAGQLNNMAFFREQQGDTSGAVTYLRESVEILRKGPPTDPSLVFAERLLALDLCAIGRAAEGDSILRSVIGRLPMDSTQAMTHRLRAALGGCLIRARRFPEAEPELLRAEAGLRALLPASAPMLEATIKGLVMLYEGWAKPEKAVEWKARLSPPK